MCLKRVSLPLPSAFVEARCLRVVFGSSTADSSDEIRFRRILGALVVGFLSADSAFLGAATFTLSFGAEVVTSNLFLAGFFRKVGDLDARRFAGRLEAVFFEGFLAFGDRGFRDFIPESAEVVGCGILNSGDQVTTAQRHAQLSISGTDPGDVDVWISRPSAAFRLQPERAPLKKYAGPAMPHGLHRPSPRSFPPGKEKSN
jgi:hypothetical protein